jgi:hypothetical protein
MSISVLLVGVSTAQSSDELLTNPPLNSPEASDVVIDKTVLEEGEVFVAQTGSREVEIIAEAKVVTMTKNYVVTVEDDSSKIIRVFKGLGVGTELITFAVMPEAEALRLVKSGGGIVEPLLDEQ